MGQKHGHLSKSGLQTLKDLSTMQLGDIHMRLEELWSDPGSSKGRPRDKDAFIRCFELPTATGDRLFAALDYDHTGGVSCEQFACSLAALLNDSVEERCALVFHALDMRGNVTKDEVVTTAATIQRALIAIVCADGVPTPSEGSELLDQSLRKAVDDAFQQYDASGSGSLTLAQLQTWLETSPGVFDILFPFTLGAEDEEEEKSKAPLDSIPLSAASSLTSENVSTSLVTEPLSSVLMISQGIPANILDLQEGVRETTPEHLGVPTELDSVELNNVTPRGSVAPEQDVFYSVTPDQHKGSVLLDMESITNQGQWEQSKSETERPEEVMPDSIHTGSSVIENLHPQALLPSGDGSTRATVGDVQIDIESLDTIAMAGEVPRHTEGVEPSAASGVWGTDVGRTEEGSRVLDIPPGGFMAIPIDGQDECAQPIPPSHVTPSNIPPSHVTPSNIPPSHVTSSNIPPSHVTPSNIPPSVIPSDDVTESAVFQSSVANTSDLYDKLLQAEGEISSDNRIGQLGSVGGFDTQSPSASVASYQPMAAIGLGQSPSVGGETTGSEDQGGPPNPTPHGVPSPDQRLPISGSDSAFDIATSIAGESNMLPSVVTIPSTPTAVSNSLESSGESKLATNQEGGESKRVTNQEGGGGDKVERRYSFHFQNDPATSDVNRTHKRVRSMSQPSMVYPENVVDRTKDAVVAAWLPDASVQDVLDNRSKLSNKPITCPGLVAKAIEGDAITEISKMAFPQVTRKLQLSVEHVSMDGAGLRRLVSAGCYNAALELTARVLSAHGQGFGSAGQPSVHTHKTMQMWSARISLLVYMRRYKEAEEELEAFKEMDNPDLYYQYHYHNYPDKCGSMVPFSLRLLHAQVPYYVNNHQLSLKRLCKMQFICGEILSLVERGHLPYMSEKLNSEYQELARNIWNERLGRVRFALGNCLVAMQDYELAVEVFKSLALQLPSLKAEIYAGIGRIYLQGSSLAKAQSYFAQVQKMAAEDQTKRPLVKSNEALAYVFQGKWEEAACSFQDVLDLQPDNMTARNNLAVCYVYQDNIKESISVMEQLIHGSPSALLQPALLSNLCDLYDVRANSQTKKLSLLPLLAEHAGDAFNVSALSAR